MYEAFYQLSADPFRLSPDAGFCFQHRSYRKAMTYMLHALHRAEGFIMITGRPGTGKTTLINDLIRSLKPDQAVVAKIVSTQLTADDLLHLVAYSFNLDPDGSSKAQLLIQVEGFLKQQYRYGRRPLLIVDEAQDMGKETLEELRLLTNIQLGTHQLLQVFLVGQEELRDTVNTPSLEQLHQRLIAATLLEPLDTDDTRAYIKHRLRRVNWTGDPLISTEAYAIIQRYSQGIPRRINQICNRLLLHGSLEEKHRLGTADLKMVIEELQQELLLPRDKAGSKKAPVWPAEQHEESYEEEPQTSPPAPETERAGQQAAAMPAEPQRHRSARVPAAVAGPGAGNRSKREHPAAHSGTRRLSSWRLLGLAGLITGLLLTLMYTTKSQLTRPADQNPVTSEHSDRQQASSMASGEFPRKISEPDEDMRTGTVIRQSSPPGQAPKSDVSENETTSHEQAQAQAHEQAHEQEQDSLQTMAPGLEEELQQSGLLIERLNNDLLKVKLSSDGLFGFDSAEIKEGARPALDKLADVLRKHDDLTVRIVGHTDSSGVAAYNLHLSQLRAKAVADYLVSRDLSDSSIQSEGRGDQDTRLEHSSSSNPGLKRRVEIYIGRDQISD